MKTLHHPMNGTIVAHQNPVFDIPHKGIRYALAQLSLLAGQTDYCAYASVAKLHKLGKQVFRFLALHAEHENEITFKYLDERAPGATDHERDEHEYLEELQHALEQQLEVIFILASEGQDVSDLGRQFYQRFSELHGLHLAHMLEEEREIEPLLHEYFSNEELQAQRREIISKNKPEELLIMWRFMFPAHNHRTRVALLKAIKSGAPEPFFASVLGMLQEVLSEKELAILINTV
ncbi:MAG: hemerythrin domain-containing protein [Saprospiraceae bacterium]|nr:hemerythrin domain-containing protein [Saprospiraceae bacterium]